MRHSEVRTVDETRLLAVLPLIAGYQRFYGGAPNNDRNFAFFSRFLAPSDAGELIAAFRDDDAVGFACLRWSSSSVTASPIAVLNDLFVVEAARGQGVGYALIDTCRRVASERGFTVLRWDTAIGNRRAQRLYERLDADRSAWFQYDLPLEGVHRG